MIRTTAVLFLSSLSASAGVKVGTFQAEVRHTFLTEDRVNCIAVAESNVYAGTARGLALYAGGSWQRHSQFDTEPVDLCAASGSSIYFTHNGSLHRMTGSSVDPSVQLPAAQLRALAVSGGRVLVATDSSLYELADRKFTPVRIASNPIRIRQIAVGPSGTVAVAAEQGLFVRSASNTWDAVHPSEGRRSWAPVDVRGVAYDSDGRLWFASPQGVGCLDGKGWRLMTGLEGLPYDDFTTISAGERGSIWFGTTRGAIRFDGKNWEYRQGLRWLPADHIRGISISEEGNAWFATSGGVGLIERKPMTLAEKAKIFEAGIDRVHRRTEYGYVMAVALPKAGDTSKWAQHDSDNDGLWTSMYGAGECFAYGATKDPLAKERARKAFDALRFLSLVTQGGEHPAPKGFPARSILPTSGPDPNLRDSPERDRRMRESRDHLWKQLSPRWPKSADGKWYWKSDTSSDELDGHYFFYAQYYDLVAEAPQEKEEVRRVVRDITDHLIDHDFQLVDWDGTVTRWGKFNPAVLNDSRFSWADRGLNSLSILSYLKVAEHMTGDPKYRRAYDKLVREHGYATNAMVAKITTGPGSGNQSDDEMAFMNYYTLIKYEQDKDLLQKYAYSLSNYWSVERPEMNPFFNFVTAASLAGKTFTDAFRSYDLTVRGDWLEDSIDTLKRLPLDRVDWAHNNSHRKDIVNVRSYFSDEDMTGFGYRRNGKALPVDERFFEFWNHNPYRLDTGGAGNRLADGAVFLLPYYMGLYHRYLWD